MVPRAPAQRTVEVGDPLPGGLRLLAADGSPVALGAFRGEATLLVFLRHLG